MGPKLATEHGGCALCGSMEGTLLAQGYDFEYLTTREEFSFWRCSCGGTFLHPRPAPTALPTIYPENYYSYNFQDKLGPLVMRFKSLTERAKVAAYTPYLRPQARVLDIGCGDGHVLRQLDDNYSPPLDLEGVEFSEHGVAATQSLGYRVHVGPIEEVELPEAAFDLVIMNQLIEHVRDPKAVLRKIARALAPGGHLFIETPNIDSLDARLFRKRYWGGYHLPRHFHLFDTVSLGRIVEESGLRTISQKPLVCPQFWIISVQNWLKDRGATKLAEWISPFNPLLLAPATVIELIHQRVSWTSNQQVVAQAASSAQGKS
ncbi:MAG: class I SAM-dependent methyltransferase [Candidatus Binatia bacterium]|nr:class I SAM-dependent methyltransferase [Candidatus Binatia bacterium]MDG2011378.1 class I SAM-dependent methyltransferase [Candidatus Binatia bacterium]